MNLFKKYRSPLIVSSIFLFPVLFYFLLSIGKHGYTRLSYYTTNQTPVAMELAPKIEQGRFVNQKK